MSVGLRSLITEQSSIAGKPSDVYRCRRIDLCASGRGDGRVLPKFGIVVSSLGSRLSAWTLYLRPLKVKDGEALREVGPISLELQSGRCSLRIGNLGIRCLVSCTPCTGHTEKVSGYSAAQAGQYNTTGLTV